MSEEFAVLASGKARRIGWIAPVVILLASGVTVWTTATDADLILVRRAGPLGYLIGVGGACFALSGLRSMIQLARNGYRLLVIDEHKIEVQTVYGRREESVRAVLGISAHGRGPALAVHLTGGRSWQPMLAPESGNWGDVAANGSDLYGALRRFGGGVDGGVQ